jgi:hypothetical protein
MSSYTCTRCGVTVRWMPGHESPGLPESWSEESGNCVCLACRRELAAETSVESAPDGATRESTAKLRSRAVVEFEIQRDPERSNGEIARSIRSSVMAVAKARQRLDEDKAGSAAAS